MLEAPGGHPRTGLYRPCVLKCDWVVKFSTAAIQRRMGEMPNNHFEQATNWIKAFVEQKKLQVVIQFVNPPMTPGP